MNFPSKCPHCGKDIIPHSTASKAEKDLGHRLTIEVHRCIHCKEPIFAVRKLFTYDKNSPTVFGEYVFIYPNNVSVKFPQLVKDLSPNAYDLYSQVSTAKSNGCNALVRGGIRIALEYLLYDYLVTFKKYDEKTVSNMSLSARCDEYCKDKQNDKYSQTILETCTRLVRLVGNEVIHGKKALSIDTQEVEDAFSLLCNYIDVELQMDSLSNRLPPKPTL